MMEEKQGKVLRIIMAAILLVSMYFVAGEGAAYVNSDNVEERGGNQEKEDREKLCVVIDAGHGGADPGKVGVNGSLEKDINLKIANMVKIFERFGIKADILSIINIGGIIIIFITMRTIKIFICLP